MKERERPNETPARQPALPGVGGGSDLDALRASAAALIAAIRWSIAARADIVNLSLGSINAAHRDAFAAVTAEAAAAGVLIVAEAGGTVTDTRGGPLDLHEGEVVASNGAIHQGLIAGLDEVRRARSSP